MCLFFGACSSLSFWGYGWGSYLEGGTHQASMGASRKPPGRRGFRYSQYLKHMAALSPKHTHCKKTPSFHLNLALEGQCFLFLEAKQHPLRQRWRASYKQLKPVGRGISLCQRWVLKGYPTQVGSPKNIYVKIHMQTALMSSAVCLYIFNDIY